jgi:hypothetical protein
MVEEDRWLRFKEGGPSARLQPLPKTSINLMEVEDVEERTYGNVRCALSCSNVHLCEAVRTIEYVQHHAVAYLLRECRKK